MLTPPQTVTTARPALATARSVPHRRMTASLSYDRPGGVWLMTLLLPSSQFMNSTMSPVVFWPMLTRTELTTVANHSAGLANMAVKPGGVGATGATCARTGSPLQAMLRALND